MPTATSIDSASTVRLGRTGKGRAPGRSGQAMIESVFVILVTCFLLFSLLQLAQVFAAREVLRHASARAARARTVGFNGWMCRKVMRVASIPNAGKMLEPSYASFADAELHAAMAGKNPGALWDWSLSAIPNSERGVMEAARIPEYLASEHEARAEYILDYEGWDDIVASGLGGNGADVLSSSDTLKVNVRQKIPFDIAVKGLFDWVGVMSPSIDRGYMSVSGQYEIEDHYKLYLDDKGY